MTKVTRGSGNVFADLGLPDAEEHLVKARLVAEILRIIQKDGLTQTAAAKRVGVSQPDISKILNGNFRPFSLERLMTMLLKLGRDVTIKVGDPVKKNQKEGRLVVA